MEAHRSDYAITKPSMSALPTKKAKIIRTYGRQPSAGVESQGQPSAAKRRRVDPGRASANSIEPDQSQDSRVDLVQESQECERNGKTRTLDGLGTAERSQKVSKESILSFFKPVTKPANQEVKSESNTSSPKQEEPRSRLLRLRSASSPARKSAKRRLDVHERPHAEPGKESTGLNNSPRINPRKQPRRVLSDRGDALHNQQPSKTDMDTEKQPPVRITAKATVQTTLNISCQAAFSECKVCDTVWNPLYPDDAQLHKNRHAAFLREQRKRKRAEF